MSRSTSEKTRLKFFGYFWCYRVPEFRAIRIGLRAIIVSKSYNYFLRTKRIPSTGFFHFKSLPFHFQLFKITLQSMLGRFGVTGVRYLIGKIILKQRFDPFCGSRSVDSSRLVHNIFDSKLSMGNFITSYNSIESYSNLWSFR